MALLVNLRHLERAPVRLRGLLPVSELDIVNTDELINLKQPLKYDLEVQELDKSILVQGNMELVLECECARCLKPFQQRLELTHWACHLPLEGEEKALITSDCVDLTPYVREDILLEFPQHPLCKRECGGLPKAAPGRKKNTGGAGQTRDNLSAWAELNKLQL
jgi:uncharacterized protein